MNPNERIEQQETINNDPLRPNEIITKTVQQGPREVGLSPTTIIVIIVLAVLAIGTVFTSLTIKIKTKPRTAILRLKLPECGLKLKHERNKLLPKNRKHH